MKIINIRIKILKTNQIINFREKYSLAFSTDTILSAITFKSEKLVSSAIFPFINITASSSIKFSYFSKQSEREWNCYCWWYGYEDHKKIW